MDEAEVTALRASPQILLDRCLLLLDGAKKDAARPSPGAEQNMADFNRRVDARMAGEDPDKAGPRLISGDVCHGREVPKA